MWLASLPKKEYVAFLAGQAAKAAVSELKKSIRLVLGNRRRKLFE